VDEIGPGVWHWTAFRETIGNQVSSYYLAEERVAIDPMLPPERPEWFQPEHVLLTCRHHDRDAWQLGCPVWVAAEGAYELEGRGDVRTYEWGDELPGGVIAHEVGSLSPDETALYSRTRRALAFGDAAVRWEKGGPLGFVSNRFMDDPEADKAGLRAAFQRLLELDFDLLLLGHGDPAVGDAKEQLREFVQV
jgi:glyoxylase-like metal-dependent hydrolase (beta-lactamase superfamily II)